MVSFTIHVYNPFYFELDQEKLNLKLAESHLFYRGFLYKEIGLLF